ncbi:hypothetical protein PHYSODRAFT_485420 [Phytophthora sojae]|uniref:Uncharacterized protein n=1 Tax=Phytophthora sojae (strain P6497) TaxID=1094619 RepID=G4YRZ6_PHYSP|nr:hypothetical protein PHYSODRAFT_485420 [Phytophthora sojae]EGZ24133.1 hypothetical protein PHYSODRAFT_485420 [Phytophthora sojae]|eukprot:XP_009519421.1 hypothetical protein PHYSODRAFT_485420 [Phytophthora sojae]
MIPTYDKRATRARISEDLPQTTKLFSKLSKASTSKSTLEDSDRPTEPLRNLDTPKTSSRPSNIAALEAIKQQMARDIQDQIASTKAALREMEVCSASGKTLEEEEEELRQLQQQLTAKSSEMVAAMDESRSKLQELFDPTTASSFSDTNRAEDDKMGSNNQEPTIFDSTALVNELIARAEQAPALLYKKWTNDRSRKIAQLATYRDQQAVIQAQQSMRTFQQTLAEFRNQR